jgi:hypothetical protein
MTKPDPTPAAVPPPIPNWPGEALETAIAGARIANPILTGRDGQLHALVPKGFDLKTMPDSGFMSTMTKQRVTVDDRASLSAYANRFSGPNSIIIADYDAGTISARLDWHPHNEMPEKGFSAPDAHSVTLKLRFSEEFARWDAMARKSPQHPLHPQEDFARFLEENSADVAFPEAGVMIEISRDFEATVGQSYKSAVRLDNGDRRLRFESESKALNDVIIPQQFTLNIPIYNGEPPDVLTANFRWRAQPQGGVLLGFEWHRLEYLRRAHFIQIATSAAEETGLPVFIGRQG